jgi:DNA-binding NarL/FixJ family response regulator
MSPKAREPLIRVLVASQRVAVVEALSAPPCGSCGILIVDSPVKQPKALVEQIRLSRPDVLLLDQTLLKNLDAAAVSAMADAVPAVRVLLIANRSRPRLAATVLRNRFHGYVTGQPNIGEWLKAIRGVHRGELWLPRLVLAEAIFRLGHAPRRPPRTVGAPSRRTPALTLREDQVTTFLRKGYSNKEIATELGIKEDTVKKHLRKVFGKFGVRRRTQLLVATPAVG